MEMGGAAKALIFGLLLIVIGLVLLGTVIDTATTTGGNAKIGSFTGTQDLNDLAPLIFVSIVIVAGAGLIGAGAFGIAGKGPLGN